MGARARVGHAKMLRKSVVSASQIARVEARNEELRELFKLGTLDASEVAKET